MPRRRGDAEVNLFVAPAVQQTKLTFPLRLGDSAVKMFFTTTRGARNTDD